MIRCFIIGMLFAYALPSSPRPAQKEAAHIIYIRATTTPTPRSAPYGLLNPSSSTPNLDKLAKKACSSKLDGDQLDPHAEPGRIPQPVQPQDTASTR